MDKECVLYVKVCKAGVLISLISANHRIVSADDVHAIVQPNG